MALFGNLGPIFSGVVMTLVSKAVSRLGVPSEDAFEQSLKVLTGCMVGAGGVISWLHHFVHSLSEKEKTKVEKAIGDDDSALPSSTGGEGGIITRNTGVYRSTNNNTISETSTLPQNGDQPSDANVNNKNSQPGLKKTNKPKLSFFDSVKVLLKDKYLMNLALMVVSYGLTMEFTEIIWKSTVKKGIYSVRQTSSHLLSSCPPSPPPPPPHLPHPPYHTGTTAVLSCPLQLIR